MRKSLYIPYILLLIIEWLIDMIVEIIKVIHKSFETMALATQKYINEPTKQIPSD
jgi:hypothetical protein